MKSTRWLPAVVLAGVVLGMVAASPAAEPAGNRAVREGLLKAEQAGNFNDAYQGFRKLAIEVHKGNWRLLQAAGAIERDRIRALQLMAQGLPLASDPATNVYKAQTGKTQQATSPRRAHGLPDL